MLYSFVQSPYSGAGAVRKLHRTRCGHMAELKALSCSYSELLKFHGNAARFQLLMRQRWQPIATTHNICGCLRIKTPSLDVLHDDTPLQVIASVTEKTNLCPFMSVFALVIELHVYNISFANSP